MGAVKLYEIKYKFMDELGDPMWRYSFLCVYDSEEEEGELLDSALNELEEEGGKERLDKVLMQLIGREDDDICFYYDISSILESGTLKGAKLVCEIQKSFDIIVSDIND